MEQLIQALQEHFHTDRVRIASMGGSATWGMRFPEDLAGEDKVVAKFEGFDLKMYHLFLGFKLLLLLNLAFLGTGNLVSISGFNLESSNRLVISFHPLIMGGLFLLKLITPFFLSITAFVAVCKAATKASALVIFVLMLIFVEFVNVTFFFLIRTDGSW